MHCGVSSRPWWSTRTAVTAQRDVKTWGKRAGYVGRGLIYAGLAVSAVKILLGSGESSQNQRAHKTAGVILSWPAGTWIVSAIGPLIIGAGIWNLYRGLSRTFEDRWRTGEMSHTARTWGGRVGV